jgi:hypothetical protein
MTPPKYARIDFPPIRSVALRNAIAICNRILPGGRVVGNEYIVRNPKREDRKVGSFKVNLRSGRWSDFATGERGARRISREDGISIAHAPAVLQANGIAKEPRDD